MRGISGILKAALFRPELSQIEAAIFLTKVHPIFAAKTNLN